VELSLRVCTACSHSIDPEDFFRRWPIYDTIAAMYRSEGLIPPPTSEMKLEWKKAHPEIIILDA
jgi:hypothetical protein